MRLYFLCQSCNLFAFDFHRCIKVNDGFFFTTDLFLALNIDRFLKFCIFRLQYIQIKLCRIIEFLTRYAHCLCRSECREIASFLVHRHCCERLKRFFVFQIIKSFLIIGFHCPKQYVVKFVRNLTSWCWCSIYGRCSACSWLCRCSYFYRFSIGSCLDYKNTF